MFNLNIRISYLHDCCRWCTKNKVIIGIVVAGVVIAVIVAIIVALVLLLKKGMYGVRFYLELFVFCLINTPVIGFVSFYS